MLFDLMSSAIVVLLSSSSLFLFVCRAVPVIDHLAVDSAH
jgi:hypothetical protein